MVGGVLGLAAAFALARGLQSLIVGVLSSDPLTYASTAAGVAAVALLACWVPALRANRVDPVTALRE